MLLAIFIVSSIIVSVLLSMYYLAHKDHVDEFTLNDPSFPVKDRTFSIFFIADIHNRGIKESTLDKVTDIDCVIIGGDLVDKRVPTNRLRSNIDLLKQWGAPIYFIPGNNDHELEEEDILDVLKREGVLVLSNRDNGIDIDGSTKLTLSGIDPYFLMPRRHTFYSEDSQLYQILCVHDPFVFKRMNKEDQSRFNLILSGHTHGGQIRIFGLGAYQRGGWFHPDGRTLLITEGYGTSLVPLRLGTQAECHIIRISQ